MPFQERDVSKLGRIIEKDEGRSMRAVKGSLGHSPKERYRNRKVSMRAVKIAIIKIRRKAGSRYSSFVKCEAV